MSDGVKQMLTANSDHLCLISKTADLRARGHSVYIVIKSQSRLGIKSFELFICVLVYVLHFWFSESRWVCFLQLHLLLSEPVCWTSKSLWSCLLDSSECLRVLLVLKIRAAGSDTWHGQRRCRGLLLCLLCGETRLFSRISPVLPRVGKCCAAIRLQWLSEFNMATACIWAIVGRGCLSDYFRIVTCHCFDNAVELLLICVCLVAKLIYATVPWKVFHIPERKDFISLYCCKQINQTPC